MYAKRLNERRSRHERRQRIQLSYKGRERRSPYKDRRRSQKYAQGYPAFLGHEESSGQHVNFRI